MLPGKVAAIITRRLEDRTELCVFERGGGIQLPAGTMEVGEFPIDSATREAWEETGLADLELVGEVAMLDEFDAEKPANAVMMMARHEGCPIGPGHTVLVQETIGATLVITSEFHGWTGEVDAWEPMFETAHRRLVPLADVNDVLHWRAPPFVRWLDVAVDAEARSH